MITLLVGKGSSRLTCLGILGLLGALAKKAVSSCITFGVDDVSLNCLVESSFNIVVFLFSFVLPQRSISYADILDTTLN